MRTLIIISHPTIEESLNQQFFKEASAGLPATWHHLESSYPDGKIDIETELQLLAQHDRIIFQFPFYWYSSPAHLKIWQDNVLERAAHVLKRERTRNRIDNRCGGKRIPSWRKRRIYDFRIFEAVSANRK